MFNRLDKFLRKRAAAYRAYQFPVIEDGYTGTLFQDHTKVKATVDGYNFVSSARAMPAPWNTQ